jgi:predicted Fe-S protein YdhL (DUF1289 family)
MNKLSKLVCILVWIIGLTAVFGAITMYLWNMLLPPIFGLPILNWPQAAGLLVLSRILVGGVTGGLGGIWGMGCRRIGTNPFRAGWNAMSDEQRQHLAEEIQKRHGFDPRRSGCGPWTRNNPAEEPAEEKKDE